MSHTFPFPQIIDSSALSTFKSCPQKFFYSHVAEYKPKGVSVHLHAGKSFARGLEVTRRAFFEQGLNDNLSIARGLAALIEAYGDYQCPPEESKSLERVAGAFEYYFTNYPLGVTDVPITFGEGRRGIEFSFTLPLPIKNPSTGDPILYSGRMDAISDFAGGVYIVDEKTTKQLGQSWTRQWDLRGQFIGYAWGCREHGIRVDGSLIRGVSILKTKYDTAQAVVRHAEWQVDKWFDETLWWIEQMIEHYVTPDADLTVRDGFWPHNYGDSCANFGGCQFRSVCMSQDPQPWLEQGFDRKHWDPVLGVETLLSSSSDTGEKHGT